MLDKSKQLGNFHYNQRNKDESESYEVHMPRKHYNLKCHTNGSKENHCNKKNGNKSCPVESLVLESTDGNG